MGEVLIGVSVSIVGAIIFYSLAAYSLSRKERDLSHHLFAAFSICIGSSQLLAFFEFIGTKEIASVLLKFDLTFLILGAYHYVLFADYFRERLNKKFMLVFGIPTILIVAMVFTFMIKAVIPGPYGWAGVYYPLSDFIYGLFGIICIITGSVIFLGIRKIVDDERIKKKMNFFIAGSLIGLIGATINVIVIQFVGRVFPIVETTLMISGIMLYIGLTK